MADDRKRLELELEAVKEELATARTARLGAEAAIVWAQFELAGNWSSSHHLVCVR